VYTDIHNYYYTVLREGAFFMKPTELKQQYIQLRAEGKSYSFIAKQLQISKSTCTKWEREFAREIDELKRAELAALYESYSMTKEARIRKLGSTLDKINEALEKVDFSEVDPARLMDYKLKYMEALKGEYVGTQPAIDATSIEARNILEAITDLLNRTRQGDITSEQSQRESMILSNLLKAYDLTEVKAKLDELEAIVGGRS
jgi:hypothetical protein